MNYFGRWGSGQPEWLPGLAYVVVGYGKRGRIYVFLFRERKWITAFSRRKNKSDPFFLFLLFLTPFSDPFFDPSSFSSSFSSLFAGLKSLIIQVEHSLHLNLVNVPDRTVIQAFDLKVVCKGIQHQCPGVSNHFTDDPSLAVWRCF